MNGHKLVIREIKGEETIVTLDDNDLICTNINIDKGMNRPTTATITIYLDSVEFVEDKNAH